MPPWFGVSYPSLSELENLAASLGAPVFYDRYRQPFLQWDKAGPLCIVVPSYSGKLPRFWAIAHELGHLVNGHGPLDHHLGGPMEEEADEWAAEALIPEERIRKYGIPSVEGCLRALGKHYQEIPKTMTGVRPLGCRIAFARLRALGEVG